DATNSSSIDATVITVSLSVSASGGVAVDVGIAALNVTNDISSETRAAIYGSEGEADGGVSVTALNDESIDATGASIVVSVAASSSIAVGVGAAAAVVTNISTADI